MDKQTYDIIKRIQYQVTCEQGIVLSEDDAKKVLEMLQAAQSEDRVSMMAWNEDMSQAPRDGTNILVINPANNEVIQVGWSEEEIHYPECEVTWAWCVPYSHQDEQGGCVTVSNPIKWMFLPKP